jgi:hypothetical protein
MSCNCNNCNITINAGGEPYIANTQVVVGTDTVNIALGWRRIQPIGKFIVRMENPIPSDATTTLPVTLTLNGTTRNLTLFDGTQVAVADLIGGTGVFLVFNDRFNGILQLVSRTVEA